MTRPLRAWNAFWFGPTSARPLAAFRIAFGCVALMNLALLATDLDHWFTDAGVLRGVESAQAAGPLRPSLLHHLRDPIGVRVYFGALAAVTVLLTVGWHARIMAVLFYLGMLSVHHRNIYAATGADILLMVLAFYLMLSPCGAALSLDARRAARRRGTAAEPLIEPWAQRLIQIQLSLIYFVTAVLKCHGSTWLNGTALHFVLNNTEIRRWSLGLESGHPLLLNAMSHAALALEFALAFLLWVRPMRPWLIAGGVALHGGILVMINIPCFGELMVACYLTFLSPEEFQALARLLNPLRIFRRPEPEPSPEPAPAPDDHGWSSVLAGPHRPGEVEVSPQETAG